MIYNNLFTASFSPTDSIYIEWPSFQVHLAIVSKESIILNKCKDAILLRCPYWWLWSSLLSPNQHSCISYLFSFHHFTSHRRIYEMDLMIFFQTGNSLQKPFRFLWKQLLSWLMARFYWDSAVQVWNWFEVPMIKHSSSVLLGLVHSWAFWGISTNCFNQLFSVPESESQ